MTFDIWNFAIREKNHKFDLRSANWKNFKKENNVVHLAYDD